MKRSFVLAAFYVLSATNAYALCQDGPPFACVVNGKHGFRQCVGGHITPCIGGPDAEDPSATGTVAPKYFVLTVIYAPPGTQGGRSTSSVSYGSGSSTGTTTSGSQSFKQNYAVSVTAGGGFLASAQVGVSFAYGRSTADNQSLDIKKSAATTLKTDGPSKDGIDHERDLIYLWMNPKIAMKVTSSSAAWTFSGAGTADIQYLYVGWLKNPAQMPPGVTQALARNGITSEDFPGILTHDPFANGLGPMPAPRFVSLNTTFPYEPPFAATDPVPTTNIVLTSSTTNTTGTSASDDYKVGLTLSADASFLGLAKVSFKNDDSWEWTNTSAKSSATGSTESASVTIGGPAFGYTGSTDIAVFYDTVYKTFVFQPIGTDTPLTFRGKLLASNGQPIALREVTATVNGKSYRTFTDAQGVYRFYGAMSGPVRVQSGTLAQTIPRVHPDTDLQLRMQ